MSNAHQLESSEKAQPMAEETQNQGPTGCVNGQDWFGGLTITALDTGETLLISPVIDQAALFGVLRQVRDLGTPLLSVVCVTSGEADASDSQ